MNREILFRGFHPCEDGKDRVFVNDKWIKGEGVEGYYTRLENKTFIAKIKKLQDKKEVLYHVEIIPETVGQYTGVCDKNGKKIFEGDIVKTKKYGKIIGNSVVADFDIFKVIYEPAVFRLENRHDRGFNLVGNGAYFEVIGNIHSNPELLEAEV